MGLGRWWADLPPWARWALGLGAATAAGGAVAYVTTPRLFKRDDSEGGDDAPPPVRQLAPGNTAPAGAPDDGTTDELPSYLLPVPGGVVTSPFGPRTINGKSSNHDGVDFRAAEGTDLVAPGDGNIVRVWSDTLNGNALRLKTTDGHTFGFAHLSRVDVKQGDDVSRGDVLGATGGGHPGEGASTAPHLHVKVTDATGTVIDPESLHWVAA